MTRAYKEFFIQDPPLDYLLKFQRPTHFIVPTVDELGRFIQERCFFLQRASALPPLDENDLVAFHQIVADLPKERGSSRQNLALSTAWALSVFRGFPEATHVAFTPPKEGVSPQYSGLYPSGHMASALGRVPLPQVRLTARRMQAIMKGIEVVCAWSDKVIVANYSQSVKEDLDRRFGLQTLGSQRDYIGQEMKDTTHDIVEALQDAIRILRIPPLTRSERTERRRQRRPNQLKDPATFAEPE